MSLASIPQGLQPLFRTQELNSPITLYQGAITITQTNKEPITGEGIVWWRWLLSPTVSAEVQLTDTDVDAAYDAYLVSNSLIHIPGFEPVPFIITGYKTGNMIVIDGRVSGMLRPSSFSSLQELCFHVPNFPDYHGNAIALPSTKLSQGGWYSGRMEMAIDGWKVTLDSLPETAATIKKLNAVGGYAITHVGRLHRSSGEFFSLEEAQALMHHLSYFLTFVAGRWSQPILWWTPESIGGDLQIFVPVHSRLDTWAQIHSWANTSGFKSAEHISALFPLFIARFHTAPELLKLSISWYVEALSDKLVSDSRIILTQVALELLGGKLPSLLGRKATGKAEHRVRNLLALTVPTVSTEVPAELTRLTALLTSPPFNNWNKSNNGVVDGPSVLVSVRNKIAHSTNNAAEKALLSNAPVMYEVSQLGLWQLELVLLGWFGYVGKYRLRVNLNGWVNEGEDFPLTPSSS